MNPLLLLKYWKFIAGAALLAVIAWGFLAYRHSLIAMGDKAGSARVQAEWSKATAAANEANLAKDAEYQRALGERDAAAAQVTALLTRPPIDPKTLIVQVPTNAPVTSCPDRGPEYRLRYNEIADSAANR